MTPVANFFITLFFGAFGVHKFIKKKYGLGFLYLFTGGLLGVGWIVDIFIAGVACFQKKNDSLSYTVTIYKETPTKAFSPAMATTGKPKNPFAHLKNLKQYVVIDFETTGFSATKNKAIEVGCLKVKNNTYETYQTFIDPKEPIPQKITNLTGIRNEDVSGQPDIISVANEIHKFSEGLPFVAHNASYDMRFLKQAYLEAGIVDEPSSIDTLKLARAAFPEYETHKLEFLIEKLNLADQKTHRAMDDVYCTKKLFDICVSKLV